MAQDTFTRREVGTALLVTAIAMAARPPMPAITLPPAHVFDFAIAGGWHHGLRRHIGSLAFGTRLALIGEPDNPHDPDAVAVLHATGDRLGYVPRAANAPVAAMLRAGREAWAIVAGRLDCERDADIPEALVFTGFTTGDPLLRLYARG
jgi:hypothetical protein